MKPIAKFSALFLWPVLLIAVTGIAGSLAHSVGTATLVSAIVAGGAAACLIRLQRWRAVSTRALKTTRVQREQRAYRDRNGVRYT